MYSNQPSITKAIVGNFIISKSLIVLVSLLFTFVFWTNVTLAAVTQSRVIQSTDDAEERISTGAIDLLSSDLELITDGSKTQVVGMRFQNLAIPKGSTVTNAYVEFETDETHSVPTSLEFYAQASDNAPVFTTTAFGISSRLKTTANIPWNNLSSWTIISEKHRTPNLAPIIQEVISRTG